ncbi:Sarcospan [Holothuria leucospilota]|uniref:Sarcospan n=1 Tax=Holothuria leucospilota TaxID=206669 RepID=A0A9Q1CLG9_HOLLE|nr:Sarcospan [Holothuria leucospilota]
MPDYDGSNSSRSTGPAMSFPRTSRSSRSSSLPELRYFHPDQSVSTPLKELSEQGDNGSTQIHFPVSEPMSADSGNRNQKYMLDCCSLPMVLVTLQILVGFTIVVVAITMLLMTPSVWHRDAPYWAGIVLLLTGGIGLYFNAIKRGIYERSRRGVFIKIAFFTLSVVCLFVNSIASAFCGIQTRLVSTILSTSEPEDKPCRRVEKDCICRRTTNNEFIREHVYEDILDCESFLINLRTYMYIQCALNAIGAIASFMAAMLMWRRRYAEFHSGLRFYSYSAALPSRPWEDRHKPHYMDGDKLTNGTIPNGHTSVHTEHLDTTPHR